MTPMTSPGQNRFLVRKVAGLKRAGYAFIAVGLIFFTFLSMTPELAAPSLAAYSYLLLGAGFLLVILNKGCEIIQHSRLKKLRAYCLFCGWTGRAEEWYRAECCPECDSEQVTLS